MCKICEEAQEKFKQNVARSGTEQEVEGDIMRRETLWRELQEQKAKCGKK